MWLLIDAPTIALGDAHEFTAAMALILYLSILAGARAGGGGRFWTFEQVFRATSWALILIGISIWMSFQCPEHKKNTYMCVHVCMYVCTYALRVHVVCILIT